MNESNALDCKSSSERKLFQLLDQASDEISAYRKRQLTTFREIVIVQGLVTWGVSKLQLGLDPAAIAIRIAAAIACLAAAAIGMWIMASYRKRIHHIRDSRDKLVKEIISDVSGLGARFELFYPTDPMRVRQEYQTRRTSLIYSWMLLVVGVLTSLVNVLGIITRSTS